MNDLTGKIIVISGGAGLLGEQYAAAIKEAGGTPVSIDHHQSSYGGYQIDVTDYWAIKDIAFNIERQFGTPHGLINNAAIDPKVGSDYPSLFGREWEGMPESWNVQIQGSMNCSRVFGTKMAENGRGSIVMVSSELGLVSPNQSLYPEDHYKPLHYSVTKHAVIGMTRWLATYFGKMGVRVNAIAPGGMQTSTHDPSFVARRSALIPMGRMAQTGEFNGLVVFLLSDASSYMTGAVVSIDGGYTCW